ncbi:MAG: hypothetical protein IJH99_02745 [Eubacterium sp.]|nr:hypothetical protein [Eubacterium sp.]
MSYREVAERLRAADKASAEEIAAILALDHPDPEQVYPHLRRYILSRFLLDDSIRTDDLKELVSSSISKSLEISEYDLAQTDLSDRCISAPSVETKLALVMLKFEEALGIKLSVMERVDADTLYDYAEAVCRYLQ